MHLFQFCILLLLSQMMTNTLSISLIKDESSDEEDSPQPSSNATQTMARKRDGGMSAALIGAAISAGASLVGTTVSALQKGTYSVTVSGSVENYSKWGLVFDKCEIKSGQMNIAMTTVAPAQREGFASHKTGHVATGSWVKCSFNVDNNKKKVHFMYSAPFNFNHFANVLAVAICSSKNDDCKQLNADQMMYDINDFMARREYYAYIYRTHICKFGLCITGVMGTSHQPTIDLKVLPVNYTDLSEATKDSAVRDQWTKEDYENYVASFA